MNTPHTLLIGKREHKSLKKNIVTRFHPPLKTHFHEFTFSPPGEYSYLIIYYILTNVFTKIILYGVFIWLLMKKKQIKNTEKLSQYFKETSPPPVRLVQRSQGCFPLVEASFILLSVVFSVVFDSLKSGTIRLNMSQFTYNRGHF